MLTTSEKFARLSFRIAKPMKAYAIIALIVSFIMYIAPLLSMFAALFVMIIIAIIVVVTIFLILLNAEFRAAASDTTEFTNRVVEMSTTITQYAIIAVAIAVLFASLSIVAALPDRTNERRTRTIVSNIIIIGVCVLCGLMYINIPLA